MREPGGKVGGQTLSELSWNGADSAAPVPGRQSLVQLSITPAPVEAAPTPAEPAGPTSPMAQLPHYSSIQRMFANKVQAKGAAGRGAPDVHAAAAQGISGPASQLPHLEQIQRSFGKHDVSHVQAHLGSEAKAGAQAMGAEAFATGDHVAFANSPSLHIAAHEAAHVVQQRGGVHLKGGVGETGDAYERNADAVAARVVQGKSAADLLGGQGPVSDPPQRPAKAACGECGGAPAGTGECPACKATQALEALQAAAMPAAPAVQRQCDPSVSSCPAEDPGASSSQPEPNASYPPAASQEPNASVATSGPNASMPPANATEVPLHPNQTCTNEELRAAEAAMHAICDNGVSSCNPNKISKKKLAKLDCEEVAARLALNKACLEARIDFQKLCFNGLPDPRHVIPMEETQRGIVHCETLLADCLKRRQEQEQPKTVPVLERVLEVLAIMGLSLALAAAIVAALADPEPASKVALALGSAALALILLEKLGIQPEEGFEGA